MIGTVLGIPSAVQYPPNIPYGFIPYRRVVSNTELDRQPPLPPRPVWVRFDDLAPGVLVGGSRLEAVPAEFGGGLGVLVIPRSIGIYPDRAAPFFAYQVPLRLAYAFTVHSMQGMTVPAAIVNASGTFSPGLSFVAISRVSRISGLRLLAYDRRAFRPRPAIDAELARLRSTGLGPLVCNGYALSTCVGSTNGVFADASLFYDNVEANATAMDPRAQDPPAYRSPAEETISIDDGTN